MAASYHPYNVRTIKINGNGPYGTGAGRGGGDLRHFTLDRGPPAGSFAPWPDEAMRQARVLAGQPSPPVRAQLDRLEHWRAPYSVGALPAEPPAPVTSLARRLRDQLAASGFASDLKSSWSVGFNTTRQFRPHVTLARKVQRPPSVVEMQSVTWGFTDFVLVDSKTLPEGSVYTVLERFSFAR